MGRYNYSHAAKVAANVIKYFRISDVPPIETLQQLSRLKCLCATDRVVSYIGQNKFMNTPNKLTTLVIPQIKAVDKHG